MVSVYMSGFPSARLTYLVPSITTARVGTSTIYVNVASTNRPGSVGVLVVELKPILAPISDVRREIDSPGELYRNIGKVGRL